MPPPRIRRQLQCNCRCLQSSCSVARPQKLTRAFSSSPVAHTENRDKLWKWLNGPGRVFKTPREGSTNYLGAYDKQGNLIRERRQRNQTSSENEENEGEESTANEEGDGDAKESSSRDGGRKGDKTPAETQEDLRPFPLNPYFRSQPVLSEELRDEIFKRIVKQGQTVREVSMALHVDMRRVGAVVRLKTIEHEWEREGKKHANTYAKAVLKMLPQTPLAQSGPNSRQPRHESINDLPVHPRTLDQVFHPVSESKHFTRRDAGRVFDRTLRPADERIPHPQMITDARARRDGVTKFSDRMALLRETFKAEVEERKRWSQAKEDKEARVTTVVVRGEGEGEELKGGKGIEFRFKDFNAEKVGKNERSKKGVGWRYGIPHEDRKKNQVKIPTVA